MSFELLHEQALRKGLEYYIDPGTGLMVSTQIRLLVNGHCCGSGCRHCPYEPRHKKGTTKQANAQAAQDSVKD